MTGGGHAATATRAVFFDVDFTLIYPGPTFQGEGYERFCAAHGVVVDPGRFDAAVKVASFILDEVEEPIYDASIFVRYTAAIIEHMGGRGREVEHVAAHIYDQWATNHHFEMYDDVAPVLTELAARGLALGVISNSHRSLEAFAQHFKLNTLITTAVSSAEHGFMKPHPSIFERALEQAGVMACEAMMVGDSLKADIEGAVKLGMRGFLLRRSGDVPGGLAEGIRVIASLHDLLRLL